MTREPRPRRRRRERWAPADDPRTHFERFGHLGGPSELVVPPPPSPRSWNGFDVHELARGLLARARSLRQDPDAWPVLAEPWFMTVEQREDLEHEVWQPEDLPDLLGVPMRGWDGRRMPKQERFELARDVVDLAREEDPMAATGWTYRSPSRAFRPVRTGVYDPMPPHLTEAIVVDALTHDRKNRVVLVPRDEARAFIERHHTNMPWIHDNGWIYSIGLYNGPRLAAVATAHSVTAGWPTGKNPRRPSRQVPVDAPFDQVDPDDDTVERVPLDPRNILELTRVASDGTIRGASSMLAARILKLTPATRRGDPEGPWLFVTYSLEGEKGSTYKALQQLGLRPVHRRTPRTSKTGARAGAVRRPHEEVPKIRWEAGPAALPADWSVLTKRSKKRRRR